MPFALLLPVDLSTQTYRPKLFPNAPHDLIEKKFEKAGKVTILAAQMTWVFGKLKDCAPVETFSNSLRTPAPVTGFTVDGSVHESIDDMDTADEVEGTLPRTLEAWIRAQKRDTQFEALLDTIADKACRQQLWIYAPANDHPRIIVPPSCQEALIRDVHARMFHLNHQKVAAVMERSYYWPSLRKQTRSVLVDCPECEINKARQKSAHGLFRALPETQLYFSVFGIAA